MFGKSKEHKAHENRAQGEFDEFHSAHRPPMNRSVSGWFIIMSVLYVIIGVVIFVWPGISMDIAGLVFDVIHADLHRRLVNGLFRVRSQHAAQQHRCRQDQGHKLLHKGLSFHLSAALS